MLRSFRVTNHKSFRDEAELLMLPAYDKTRLTTPVAAIFGANASGKSNLLDALRWMQTAVRESYARWEPGAGVPRTPFRLDPEAAARPSLYCVEIIVAGSRYTYGLEVDDEQVLEEWLFTYPRSRRRVIFQRERDTVRLGSTIPDHRARSERLAQQTRDNALFLTVAAHNDLDDVLPVYRWFRTGVRFPDGADVAGAELLRRLSDEQQRPAIVELVGAADLGISDISGQDAERSLAAVRADLRELVGSSRFSELLAEAGDAPLAALMSRQLGDPATRQSFLEKLYETFDSHPDLRPGRLRFHHGRSRVPLSFDDQSAGTRSWIGLISVALDAISTGGLMVVDEVDASLHTHLTARLINLFRDAETNPHGAQLLLTTHDTALLDEETLSRDEIWFVEKESDSGATRLYPLTDFHPRKYENTEGRYLAGGYGAIPVLAEYRFRRAMRPGEARDAAA